jgi:hypothetical protein
MCVRYVSRDRALRQDFVAAAFYPEGGEWVGVRILFANGKTPAEGRGCSGVPRVAFPLAMLWSEHAWLS